MIRSITYRRVIACEHLNMAPNPFVRSDVLNVAISGNRSFVLVVENGKIKLVCWTCLDANFRTHVPASSN